MLLRSRMWPRVTLGLLAGLLVLACGEAEPPAADPDPTTEPGASDPDDPTDPDDGLPADDVEPGLDAEIAAAVADAADRTGAAPEDIEVLTAERLEWADGSLGCPEPGMMYTQALVPGYRVVVAAGDEVLHYHGADGQDPGYCAEPAEG